MAAEIKKTAEMLPACGCVLLAGGQGKRLGGTDKAQLKDTRDTAFAERILSELRRLELPCYLSRAYYEDNMGCTVIRDTVTNAEGAYIGPLGGILSCLKESGRDALFFVPCDMPGFRAEMAAYLFRTYLKEDCDCAVWQTRDGRVHPVCGLYKQSCIPVMEAAAAAGSRRLMDLMRELRCRIVSTSEAHIPDSWFGNINDGAAYESFLAAGGTAAGQAVLAVSGRKNTGKTTLLEKLIGGLTEAGVRVAAIKHDAHEFEPDVPGTDSWRLKKAGALGTAIYSGSRYCIVKDENRPDPAFFLTFFPEADMILLEGHKSAPCPKIEVMRSCVSREPVCDPDTVIAYAADWIEQGSAGSLNGRPVFALSDIDGTLETVISIIDGRNME